MMMMLLRIKTLNQSKSSRGGSSRTPPKTKVMLMSTLFELQGERERERESWSRVDKIVSNKLRYKNSTFNKKTKPDQKRSKANKTNKMMMVVVMMMGERIVGSVLS